MSDAELGVAVMVEGRTSTQRGHSQLGKQNLTVFEEEMSRTHYG